MIVTDFSGDHVLKSAAELEGLLATRYGPKETNELWMPNGAGEFPTLCISVRGSLAVLHYLTEDRDPGFQSVGDLKGLISMRRNSRPGTFTLQRICRIAQ